MKKIIKKYGNMVMITFTRDDRKIYELDEGDTIEISDMVVLKKRTKGGKKK